MFINNKRIYLILIDRDEDTIVRNLDQNNLEILNTESYLKVQFSKLEEKFKYISKKSFDSIIPNKNYLFKISVSNNYFENLLNKSFSNLDFQFKYPLSFASRLNKTEITIKKPEFNCSCKHICSSMGEGRKICKIGCKVGKWLPGPVQSAILACKAADNIWPANYTITIGSVGGDFSSKGVVSGTLKEIKFTNSLENVSITKDINFNGNINYDFAFTSLDKFSIERTLFFLASQCLRLGIKGNPEINGTIPENINASLVKAQNCNITSLKINIDPIEVPIKFNHPPALDVFNDFKNYFTCPVGIKVVGIFLPVAQILPSKLIPDKIENEFNAVTKGKYTHIIELKSFEIPLEFKHRLPFAELEGQTFWGKKSINITASMQEIED
jgi:hypothetical protein